MKSINFLTFIFFCVAFNVAHAFIVRFEGDQKDLEKLTLQVCFQYYDDTTIYCDSMGGIIKYIQNEEFIVNKDIEIINLRKDETVKYINMLLGTRDAIKKIRLSYANHVVYVFIFDGTEWKFRGYERLKKIQEKNESKRNSVIPPGGAAAD